MPLLASGSLGHLGLQMAFFCIFTLSSLDSCLSLCPDFLFWTDVGFGPVLMTSS